MQKLGFSTGPRWQLGLRQAFLTSFVLCALGLTACHFKHAARATVVLQGNQSATEKLDIAKRTAVAVWNHGDLKRQVAARFPELKARELDGLYLKWDDARVHDAGKVSEVVSVMVFFQTAKKNAHAQDVANYCKTLIEKKLSQDPAYKP